MLTDGDFVRCVREKPEDDTPRLMYADWLEENGDEGGRARAELIRLQITLDTADLSIAERSPLAERVDAILAEYGAKWLGLPILHRYQVGRAIYRRGFIDEVEITEAGFFEYAVELSLLHPVRRWTLSDKEPEERVGYRVFWDWNRCSNLALERGYCIEVAGTSESMAEQVEKSFLDIRLFEMLLPEYGERNDWKDSNIAVYYQSHASEEYALDNLNNACHAWVRNRVSEVVTSTVTRTAELRGSHGRTH